MPITLITAMVLPFIAGIFIVLQAPINARLGEFMGGTLVATFLSFSVGCVILAMALLITRKPIPLDQIPNTAPWMWIGGILGAFLVFSSIYAVPKIGTLAMVMLVVGGQILATLVVDHYGFLLPKPFPITPMRLMGAFLLVCGMFMVLWPKAQ